MHKNMAIDEALPMTNLRAVVRKLPLPGKLNFFHEVDAREIIVPDGASYDYVQLAHKLNIERIDDMKNGDANILELLYVEAVSKARYLEELIVERLRNE